MKKTKLIHRLTLLFLITFSIQFQAVAQLCGVYTIDSSNPTGGTNYQSFTDAAIDLNSNGISCAVTFNIAAGTYNDNISLGIIVGSSATNTISFIGAGASSTLLTYDGASTEGTWQMSGTSNIIIKHLTIENTKSSSDAWGIHMMNAAEYITIDSCSVLMPISNTTDVGAIVVSGSLTALSAQGNNANHISITNCYIEGAYQGLRLSGQNSATGDIEDFYVANNVFNHQHIAALQILDVKNFTIEYNVIDSVSSSVGGSNGIMLNRVNDYTINANFINKDGGTGLDLTAGNKGYTTTQNSVISNNMINNIDGVCFNPVNYENTNIYNNTMISGQGAPIITNSHTVVDIRNNIFVAENSLAFRSQVAFTSADIVDNNLYYTPELDKYRIGSTFYTDLATWQTGMAGFNATSIEAAVAPTFVSATDFHMGYDLNAYDNGVDVGIVTDIDGEVRPQGLNFDIGADEFILPTCPAPSPISVSNVSSNSLDLDWIEIGSATTWNIEWGPAGFTPGSGTNTSTTSNPYSVTNLNPITEYDFYVQSDCGGGDLSNWSGPFTIYTACGAIVAPFYEGFNSGSLPLCWDNLSSNPSTSANNFWKFDNGPAYGAANHGRTDGTYAWSDGSSVTSDSIMLITTDIDISQLTSPYLSFEWFSNNTNNPGDNVPLIIEVFDGTSWNLLDTLMGDSTEWLFVNYDLNAFLGSTIKIRFMTNQLFPNSLAQYNDILLDEIRVDNCISLGGVDGSLDICRFDNTVDLNDNIIVKPNGGGEWSFPTQPNFLTQDSILTIALLPAGSYDVFYVERYVCYDTTFATINVFRPSSAGIDGVDTVCMNTPIDLFGSLSGDFDAGGQWFDYLNAPIPNSQPNAEAIPGNYNYLYVVDNGVCPSDSSIVTVTVDGSCDNLSLAEELFNDISVFPNPASNKLSILNPSNTTSLKIEMLDINGRAVLVENKALNNVSQATLSIDHLECGIYTLRVHNDEGQRTFKIVKK